MRTAYFGYYVSNGSQRWLVDLRDFISGWAALKDAKFKGGFSYNSESVLLLPLSGAVYLFVQARDNEVIKRIQRSNLSTADIHDALEHDESVGFASYVIVGDCWLGIASTLLAPRINAFTTHIGDVFAALKVPYGFATEALTEQIPKSKVQELDQVGAVTVGLNAESALLPQVINMLAGGKSTSTFNIAAMEIRLIPPRKGKPSTKSLLGAIANHLPNQGLDTLEARAKREATDHMTDIYIVGAGGVKDELPVLAERSIPNEMISRSTRNSILKQKVQEFRSDAKFKVAASAGDLHLDWKSASSSLSSLSDKK